MADRLVTPPSGTYSGKRLLDLVLASTAVLFLLPVLALVAAAVWVTMGRPVFFTQRRPGHYEKLFTILKFRTMTERRGAHGRRLPDGERLTTLGAFLRRTSLDELPELFNVLRGDMSLVGPRPLLESYVPYYRGRERLRLLARPGITGLAQVSGRNFLSWDERLELDARYVETMCLAKDVAILCRTVVQVLRHEGVSADADLAESRLDEERAATREAAGAAPGAGASRGATPVGREASPPAGG